MHFLTDFADQAVVLPLTAAVALSLVLLGWGRGALAWTVSVCAVLATMLVLKVVFAACGHDEAAWSIHSPSGHTASGAVLYAGLVTLLGNRWLGRGRLTPVIAGAIALLFGASRILLGYHTLPEVVVGAAVGTLGAWLMIRLAGPPPPHLAWHRLALVAVVVIAAFHGAHLRAETEIDDLSRLYFWPLSICRPA